MECDLQSSPHTVSYRCAYEQEKRNKTAKCAADIVNLKDNLLQRLDVSILQFAVPKYFTCRVQNIYNFS